MHLIFAYVEHEELCREMTTIVNEELEHFHLVLDILKRRNIRFQRLTPGNYARKLNACVEKFEPRLALMSEISLQEDTTENSVTFYIAGAVRSQSGTDRVEIIKTLSRMDQYPQKAG